MEVARSTLWAPGSVCFFVNLRLVNGNFCGLAVTGYLNLWIIFDVVMGKHFQIKVFHPFLICNQSLEEWDFHSPCTASSQAFAVNAFRWRIGHAELWGLGKPELVFPPSPQPPRLTLSLPKLSHFYSTSVSTWRPIISVPKTVVGGFNYTFLRDSSLRAGNNYRRATTF